jgi:integrase
MPTNAATPRASISPEPTRDIQGDAADLAALIPWLPGPPLQPRRGLTDQDLERITRATEAARAPGTHRIYRYAWEQRATWCAERGFDPLPADPAAMCAFMTQRVADGLAVISLSPFISVINYVHSAHGLPNPNDNRAVRQVRDGLRRSYGVAPVRQAHPLSVDEVRTLVTAIDKTTLGGARDSAFILLGYAGALRIGELAALDLEDLEPRIHGVVLRIRRSKTDRDAAGAKVAVARGKQPDTDPIAALQHWLQLRGTTPGPVFVPLRGGAAGDRGLAPNTFGRLLTARAKEAGLPTSERVTGHSLRAGHATEAHRAGVPIARIAAQTRHKDISVLFDRYIRPVDALEFSSSKDLGLRPTLGERQGRRSLRAPSILS